MARSKEGIRRQHRIERPPPPPATDPMPIPAAEAESLPPRFVLGKIVQVHPENQRVWVFPMKENTNPADPDDWGDALNFSPGDALCAWTMGLTLYQPGNAVIVFVNNVDAWCIASMNFVGSDYANACIPLGLLAPELEHECAPPPRPAICDQRYACLFIDENGEPQCRLRNEVECELDGGFMPSGDAGFFESCDDEDLPPLYTIGACCVGPACIFTTEQNCEAQIPDGGLGGSFAGQCRCADADCVDTGSCL